MSREKILNPSSGRYVFKDGKIGQQILQLLTKTSTSLHSIPSSQSSTIFQQVKPTQKTTSKPTQQQNAQSFKRKTQLYLEKMHKTELKKKQKRNMDPEITNKVMTNEYYPTKSNSRRSITKNSISSTILRELELQKKIMSGSDLLPLYMISERFFNGYS